MSYGLGVVYNIARQAPSSRDIARIFGSPTTHLGPSYPTTTVPKTTTTTTVPKTTTTTTASKPKTTTATPVFTPPKTTTFTPPSVSSAATQQLNTSSGTPLTIPQDGGSVEIVDDLVSPSKSPLLLIALGLGALLLLENRKKGRR